MPATLATRLSAPFTAADAPANAITDAMNAAVPWLWWPLGVPREDEPLSGGAHVLYAVHAVVIRRAARAAGVDVGPVPATVAAVAGWLWFTGAWDRRALRPSASARACPSAGR